MKARITAFALSNALLAATAHASETWTCTFAASFTKQPMLVSYSVDGNTITQTWGSGLQSRFRVLQNNEYGLIGVSSISAIEAGQKSPTVGAMIIVIGRQTREFWLSSAIIGQPPAANEPVHGTCINK